ncbi:MAG: outer membrane protein assembly factor BamB [Planctomycetota bacterium]|jgi:outer membrane protein assembly factor BamB
MRLLIVLLLSSALALAQDVTWPQFRGAQAAGVADQKPLPESWDVPAGKGLRWRTAVPGLSHASAIVAGDRVFIATAVAKGKDASLKIGAYGAGDSAEDMVEHSFQLWCLRLDDGRVDWVRTAVRCVPKFARHTKATHADPTPVTDGKHVIAVFGAQGMFCYTVAGELAWKVDLGELDVGPHDSPDLHWGYASSPTIADGLVIVQADVKTKPYLAAWHIDTGKLAWRVDRDDTTSWATPTVVDTKQGKLVYVNGCTHMGAYRLKDGSEVWRMSGGGGLPIPAPIVAGDLVLFTSNHRPLKPNHPRRPVFAVKRSATGQLPIPKKDETGDHVAWLQTRVGNYIQTPIVYRDLLYLCALSGVVSVVDTKTGEVYGRHRLGTGASAFSASPVAGDGKLYFTSEEGEVHVVKAGKEFEQLGVSPLGEICMATPAITNGTLLFRARGHVIAIQRQTGQ